MDASYPEGIDHHEFLPFGEEGGLYVVRGTHDPDVMLQGVFAALIEQVGYYEAADFIAEESGERVLSWNEDDSDKPDEQYHAEVRAAFDNAFRDRVAHTKARFWEPEHGDHPETPYPKGSGYDGGVQWEVKLDYPEGAPELVDVTVLQLD